MPAGLDNPGALAKIDSGNMLEAIYHFADPFLAAKPSQTRNTGVSTFDGILIVGMGGSASAGDVLIDWLSDDFETYAAVQRDPHLPRWVNKKTFVMGISYSGETWETLRAFNAAVNRGCSLAAIGSGGTLSRICRENKIPFFSVDPGLVPRASLGQMVVAGSTALEYFRVIRSSRGKLVFAGKELAQLRDKLAPTIPTSRNPAKQLALLLRGKLPVVYGLQRMSSVARRFKNQLAENSKIVAKYELLPEGCHNEVESWTKPNPNCLPIIIRDSQENSEETTIAKAFKQTVGGSKRPTPFEVKMQAKSELGRLLSPILFLDYVSAYLALLRSQDPTPTPGIQEYKRNPGVSSLTH